MGLRTQITSEEAMSEGLHHGIFALPGVHLLIHLNLREGVPSFPAFRLSLYVCGAVIITTSN